MSGSLITVEGEHTLDGEQHEAVRACCDTTRRVVAVTGQAGTGKTTIIRHAYRLLSEAGYSVALAAPTGKAAKRIKEATAIGASTFHRLLEFTHPGERDERTGRVYGVSMPRRDRSKPLEYDVVIGDEYAMVNVNLHSCIVGAIKPGGRLLVFGDVNQLPPIEENAVYARAPSKFKELLTKFNGITLNTIHRTGSGSGIAENGRRILRGFAPMRRDDFSIQYTDQPLSELSRYIREHRQAIDFTSTTNQVITPANVTWIGQHKLNGLIQNILRPERDGWLELDRHEWMKKYPTRVRVGDKVVINQNLYDVLANDGTAGVFNGEVGVILSINEDKDIEIDLGDRIVVIPQIIMVDLGNKMSPKYAHRDLSLAYALTTHKCQGSEYGHVIFVMNKSVYAWLNRHNLYTAVTRARNGVHLVTDISSVSRAVSNIDTTLG